LNGKTAKKVKKFLKIPFLRSCQRKKRTSGNRRAEQERQRRGTGGTASERNRNKVSDAPPSSAGRTENRNAKGGKEKAGGAEKRKGKALFL